MIQYLPFHLALYLSALASCFAEASTPSPKLGQDMDPSLVDERGSVKVNMHLQLNNERFHHIFALGDASNHPTPKLGIVAGQQGMHLAKELAAVIHKKQAAITKPFAKMATKAMVLPVGPNDGVSQLPLFGGPVFGDLLTRKIKGESMLVGLPWMKLNAKMPTAK